MVSGKSPIDGGKMAVCYELTQKGVMSETEQKICSVGCQLNSHWPKKRSG